MEARVTQHAHTLTGEDALRKLVVVQALAARVFDALEEAEQKLLLAGAEPAEGDSADGDSAADPADAYHYVNDALIACDILREELEAITA